MNLINEKRKRILSLLLIILGIAIMLYPKFSERYITYKQEKLLDLWEESLQTIEIDSSEESIIDEVILSGEISFSVNDETDQELLMEKLLIQEISKELKELKEKERKKKERIQKQRLEYINSHMEGTLKIEKISLSLPILKGTTEKNLNFSVASINGTGKPWTIGNYGIAGHRSHGYGRNFNRLDELAVGDVIEVLDTENNHYSYKVNQKIIVYAKDVWVLNSQVDKKEITLVTCHPLYEKNPPTRLIIKGEMIE